jgi:hypothetical protein
MRTARLALILAAILPAAAQAQTIIQGPVVNPTNKSRYYVLQGGTRQQLAARAAQMGGTLATIDDAAENAWIQSNLTAGADRKLFIGLSDAATEGTFVWDDGSGSAYRNWDSGGTQNNAINDFVYLSGPSAGRWQLGEATFTPNAVVEVSGMVHFPGEVADLQAAMNFARDSDAPGVQIAPGTHAFSTRVQLPVSPRRMILRGAGADASILLAATTDSIIIWAGAWIFEDLTFRRQTSSQIFRGLVTTRSWSEFRRCVFDGAGGGTIIATSLDAVMSIDRCEFTGNALAIAAVMEAGEVRVTNTVFRTPRIIEVLEGVVTMDGITSVNGGTSLFYNGFASLSVTNSIIRDATGPILIADPEAEAVFTNCIAPAALPGTGNLVGNPMLAPDLTPLPGSPCIDAGSTDAYRGPRKDFVGADRIRGTAIDLGAVESDPAPACTIDFNGDGFVDFFDYDDFVAAFEIGC